MDQHSRMSDSTPSVMGVSCIKCSQNSLVEGQHSVASAHLDPSCRLCFHKAGSAEVHVWFITAREDRA